ncbi:hypothetical protein MNBD_NITROSPINAE02-2216 [hydrothermal vent metagenome]|uniref:PRC-barrel domain-containing protein n=1 Tax=hydrothermal vent metagenome TaxID=652676 RepID=A0A3B1CJ95_9ZZZZ
MSLVTASSINYNLLPVFRVKGYYLYDEEENEVAEIRDILVDSHTRKPRYVTIEVGGFLAIEGKKLLIPWNSLKKAGLSRLDINCSQEQIMLSPVALDQTNPTREEEESIHNHFHVEPYWINEPSEEEKTEDETPSDKDNDNKHKTETPADETPIAGLEMEKNEQE